jgi:DNA-directed RNA polymerase subunit K/omega
VISKRARQIAVNLKEELNGKLAEFATTVDNLEEVFENREQIEISKYYERLPKPTSTAMEEFLEGKIMYRNRSQVESPEVTPAPEA